MSSRPRSRPAPGAIALGVVLLGVLLLAVLALALRVDVAGAFRHVLDSMFPVTAATSQGQEIRNLYDIVFYFAAAIFVVVEGLIIWIVIRDRRKPGDNELPPQTHGNNIAEISWTLIPTIIVALLFYISWQTLNTVDTVSANPDLRVKAVAGQFRWQFVYLAEDGVTEVFTQVIPDGPGGGLSVPVGRNVQVELESPDVIHAFYVPRFLYKRDVVPGQVNRFDFRLNENEAGQTFGGQCAELCGVGHRTMTFQVHALGGAEFDAWLQQQIDKAQASPGPSGSAPPPAVILGLVASGIAFDQATLNAPADKPFAIDFDNRDAGIPHDVSIRSASGIVFNGEDVTGPGKAIDNVPPLAAGEYTFFCTFHPTTMTGTLTVE
ncbi:MAG TPA: cytochrome c oxidase subunit II [Candidatus Limnocylindrales bacterium]|jgi:cytochrome c oxidase subunit 2|nr:cytochrome c oxidase subunit II [Candidatus Limnocylindrales bacterium]